jgi:hypothetical protein
MDNRTFIVTAASIFAAGTFATAAHAQVVRCSGANACKGQSACMTKTHSCKAQNACKGKASRKRRAKPIAR